jgi:hypothetical protein
MKRPLSRTRDEDARVLNKAAVANVFLERRIVLYSARRGTLRLCFGLTFPRGPIKRKWQFGTAGRVVKLIIAMDVSAKDGKALTRMLTGFSGTP